MNVSSAVNTPGMSGNVAPEQQIAQASTIVGVGRQNQTVPTEMTTGLEKQLINAIEKANQLQSGTTECQFSIHKETKQIMIKIVDTTTKEVIKEIPSEKILDMVASMCELAGLFVDEKR